MLSCEFCEIFKVLFDSEVAVDRYDIVRNERNRNREGLSCCIRNPIYYNRKPYISDNIENIFIDLLFPITKPIYAGIIYKPLIQTRLLEQMITKFELLDLNNEISILRDFSINLLLRDKCMLNKPNETKKFDKEKI